MLKCCEAWHQLQIKLLQFLAGVIEPALLLAIRVYIANVFFSSGMLKFDNYLNDDWESTVFLFEEVHPVPLLPADIAAVMGTGAELIFSTMLAFGLFGRFAALALLGVTAVIEISFTFHDPDYMTLPLHIMWALLLSVIVVRGSGRISLDSLIGWIMRYKDNPAAGV